MSARGRRAACRARGRARRARGSARRVTELQRRPCAYRTSFALEELDVTLADGRAAAADVQGPQSRACLERGRAAGEARLPARPASARSRSTATCSTAPSSGPPPTTARPSTRRATATGCSSRTSPAPCCGRSASSRSGRRPPGGSRACTRRSRRRPQAPPPSLLRYGPDLYRAVDRARASSSPSARRRRGATTRARPCMDCPLRYEPVVERLAALPPTIVHGEFYPSNVLVQHPTGDVRIAPDRLGDRRRRARGCSTWRR